MEYKMRQSLIYVGVQIALDIIFCIVAGLIAALVSLIYYSDYGNDLLWLLPVGNLFMLLVRYGSLAEFIPRFVAHVLIVKDKKFRLWMAFAIGTVSYLWVMLGLHVGILSTFQLDDRLSIASFLFPFQGEEALDIWIFLIFMILSTLISPFVINYLNDRRTRVANNGR